MTTLGAIWDGERHLLEPGVHFPVEGAALIVIGFEEQEEEDVLSPFESPTVEPVLQETGRTPDPRMPLAEQEQAWGTLSLCLGAFAAIAGVVREQYQENNHKTGETLWSFKTKQPLGDRI